MHVHLTVHTQVFEGTPLNGMKTPPFVREHTTPLKRAIDTAFDTTSAETRINTSLLQMIIIYCSCTDISIHLLVHEAKRGYPQGGRPKGFRIRYPLAKFQKIFQKIFPPLPTTPFTPCHPSPWLGLVRALHKRRGACSHELRGCSPSPCLRLHARTSL